MNKEVREKLKAAGVLAAPAEPEEKELTPAERDRQESIERHAKLRQMEQEENEERAKRIAASQRIAEENCKHIDPVAEAEAKDAAIKNNPSKVHTPQTGEDNAKAIQKHYRYNYDKPLSDPLMDKEPPYVQQLHGYIPPTLKPSIVLPHSGAQECPRCGDRVATNKSWHLRSDGTRCVYDEASAAKEGVYPQQS